MAHNSTNTILISVLKSTPLVMGLNKCPLVPASSPHFSVLLLLLLCWISSNCPFTPSPLHPTLCPGRLPYMDHINGLPVRWHLIGLEIGGKKWDGRGVGIFPPSSLPAELPWVDCFSWFKSMAPVGRCHASRNCTFCRLWDKMDSYLKYTAININLCLLQITVIDLLTCT